MPNSPKRLARDCGNPGSTCHPFEPVTHGRADRRRSQHRVGTPDRLGLSGSIFVGSALSPRGSSTRVGDAPLKTEIERARHSLVEAGEQGSHQQLDHQVVSPLLNFALVVASRTSQGR